MPFTHCSTLLPPSNLDATCQQPLQYCVQILKAAVPEETLADSDVAVFIRIWWQAWKTQDPELYRINFFYHSFFFLKESIIFKNRIWSCTRTRCMVFKGGVRWCQVEEHVSRRLGLAIWKLFLFRLCNWDCFRNFTWTESCRASLFILFFFLFY